MQVKVIRKNPGKIKCKTLFKNYKRVIHNFDKFKNFAETQAA